MVIAVGASGSKAKATRKSTRTALSKSDSATDSSLVIVTLENSANASPAKTGAIKLLI
jgi:hypothetical protein